MDHELPRRQFLKTAALVALATATAPSPAATAPPRTAPDHDPAKMARLIPGLCAYSYGQELKHGKMTLEEFFLKAVELRVETVDMTGYYLTSTEPAYLHGLRRLAYKHALPFSGAACGVSMVQPTSDQRADSLAQIKKWVDVTDLLGAPHLRIFAGKLPPGTSLQQAVGWVVETMKAACDYAAQKGVTLGLEDHVGVSQSAEVCVEIIQRVNSPYAAINLDITNFIATPAQDQYAQIATCIPYATNTHIRNYFEDQTPVDMDRVWRLFADAGFKGYMSVEYERSAAVDEPAATGVPKLVAQTRALCQKYSSV
jgi:sugar phosphate isomerase/epimerase